MTITTPNWVQDAVFYQIFPDRFAKSDKKPASNLPFESWDSPPPGMDSKAATYTVLPKNWII